MGAFYTYLLKKGYWLSIPVLHFGTSIIDL